MEILEEIVGPARPAWQGETPRVRGWRGLPACEATRNPTAGAGLPTTSSRDGGGFCHDSAKAFGDIAEFYPGRRKGGSIDSSTPACCCCDRIEADRRCMFRPPGLGRRLTGAKYDPQLRGRRRARGPALADHAVEGRALARHRRRGEAARGRAFADCARWQRRGQIA